VLKWAKTNGASNTVGLLTNPQVKVCEMDTEIVRPRDFYVYLHRKASSGEVFYVGKGAQARAWRHSGRGVHWHNIVAKYGLLVDILRDGLREWAAFELEASLITRYGRKDLKLGSLINRTDGGEGAACTSDAQKQRARDTLKSVMTTEAWRIAYDKGMTRRNASKQWREATRIGTEAQKAVDPKWLEKKRKTLVDNQACQDFRNKWLAGIYRRSESVEFRETIRRALSKPVYCIELDRVFASGKAAAQEVAGKPYGAAISKACRGERRTAHGMHWRFIDNPT
jgi:hypothetical protein